MGYTKYVYKNELDKTCFQHDMGYEDFKDLPKRTASEKHSRNKAFKIVSNLKYNGYQRSLPSTVSKFLNKKPAGSGVKSMLNQ